MFGTLLRRFFGSRKAARSVGSPPAPAPPTRPSAPVAPAPPPPPPAPAPAAVVEQAQNRPAAGAPGADPDRRRVRVILEDGTMTEPSLDPDLEERLKYIVDNIVPPTSPPAT